MTLLTAGVVTVSVCDTTDCWCCHCVTLLTAGVVTVSSVRLFDLNDSNNTQLSGTVHECFASMELVAMF